MKYQQILFYYCKGEYINNNFCFYFIRCFLVSVLIFRYIDIFSEYRYIVIHYMDVYIPTDILTYQYQISDIP